MVGGFWAHMRRKFDEGLKILLCFVSMALDECFAKRHEKSKLIPDEFFAWMATVNAPPQPALGNAIHYTISQRMYLEFFLLDLTVGWKSVTLALNAV